MSFRPRFEERKGAGLPGPKAQGGHKAGLLHRRSAEECQMGPEASEMLTGGCIIRIQRPRRGGG